jgi:hypothetical protein
LAPADQGSIRVSSATLTTLITSSREPLDFAGGGQLRMLGPKGLKTLFRLRRRRGRAGRTRTMWKGQQLLLRSSTRVY